MKQTIASDKIDRGLNGPIGSGAVAVQNSVAAGAGGVAVQGNVEGNIQVNNKKIEVNADHGAVVNIHDTPPRVKQRDMLPQPTRPVKGFVNRVNELKRLEQILAQGEVAMIGGVDGIGKSALLKQTANGNAARAMRDGVLFLEGIDERGQVLEVEDIIQRMFDKLFESDPPLKVNFDIAQTYLSNTKPLIVLNGLNPPMASLSRIADLFPRGAVLIEANRLLESETAESIEIGPLPRTESIQLLAAQARMKVDEPAQPTLDELCALLADVPLAIVTAARVIREHNLSFKDACEILHSFKVQSADVMRAGIERAYALAYSTLTELERQFLAAAALAPGNSVDPRWLHNILDGKQTAEQVQARLEAIGLLTANSPRLRMDPGFRELARIGVDEIQVKEKFINYLKMMLETQSLDWQYCTDELGNILGMVDWAAKQKRWSDVISLSRAIDPYLTLHGLWEAWRRMMGSVLQSARQLGDRANEAWALHQLGTHSIGINQPDQAIDFLRQALDLRRVLGDTVGMAYTQHNLDLLIPPISPSKDGREPPDTPKGKSPSVGKNVNFLLKTIIIGAVIAGAGYFLTTSTVNSLNLPFSPLTGTAHSVANTPALTATLVPTVIDTQTLTFTPTLSRTPTFTLIPTPQDSLVILDTLCWVGPGPMYDVVSTIKSGTQVQLLGRGSIEGWWVVQNPKYSIPCWVPSSHIQIDPNYSLSGLEIFTPPPVPTSTPTKSMQSQYVYKKQAPYAGDCLMRPAGSVCIKYDDGYIWLVYDSIIGWDESVWQGKNEQSAIGTSADYYHILGTWLIKRVPK